jgi:uncharacterized phage infection (PIP) family protein YhgE
MQVLAQYPFRTSRTIDGKTYIELTEVNEILENIQKLGPAFQQIADATEKLKTVFADTKTQTDNLLVEAKEAAGNLKEIQGSI